MLGRPAKDISMLCGRGDFVQAFWMSRVLPAINGYCNLTEKGPVSCT